MEQELTKKGKQGEEQTNQEGEEEENKYEYLEVPPREVPVGLER